MHSKEGKGHFATAISLSFTTPLQLTAEYVRAGAARTPLSSDSRSTLILPFVTAP